MVELQEMRGLKERLVVDTAENQTVHLLVSKNGSYIRLSPSTYQLLQQCHSGVSFEALAEKLSQQSGKEVTPAEVEAAYQHIVEKITAIERNATRNRFGFWLRLRLLPETVVTKIATYLSVAFHPAIAFCLLIGIAAATGFAMRRDFSLHFSPTSFWLGYALFFGSLMMHEFGHASACVRYGARPSDIGFTIYLIYPALYSDVSAAWELKRWQRVLVDLGGIFFQLVVGAAYVIAYVASDWEPLKVALLMIAGSCLFSLNPIFKFDGYWVVADALGVTNLGQQPLRIFRHLFHRLSGKPTKTLPWPASIMVVLAFYSLLSFGIWGYFLWAVLPMLGRQILGYPALVTALIQDVFHPAEAFSIERLQNFFLSTFMFVVILLMLRRVVILVRRSFSRRAMGCRRSRC